jgi:hypothetical protein
VRFLFSTDRARDLLGWEARSSIAGWFATARTTL